MESAFFDNTRLYTFCSKVARKGCKDGKSLAITSLHTSFPHAHTRALRLTLNATALKAEERLLASSSSLLRLHNRSINVPP